MADEEVAVVTLKIKGDGGDIIDMDLPPEGSQKRETFDEFVAKGWITILEGMPAPAAKAAPAAPAKGKG